MHGACDSRRRGAVRMRACTAWACVRSARPHWDSQHAPQLAAFTHTQGMSGAALTGAEAPARAYVLGELKVGHGRPRGMQPRHDVAPTVTPAQLTQQARAACTTSHMLLPWHPPVFAACTPRGGSMRRTQQPPALASAAASPAPTAAATRWAVRRISSRRRPRRPRARWPRQARGCPPASPCPST